MLLCKHKQGRILGGKMEGNKAVITFKCSACGRELKKITTRDKIYEAQGERKLHFYPPNKPNA